jgi:small ligand-binding sensory domain FIST
MSTPGTRFGVGFSELPDAFAAGRAAGMEALEQAGLDKGQAQLCLLFCTSRHDAAEFFRGVQEAVGNIRCFGGYANGTGNNVSMGYDGYQTVVGLMYAPDVQVDIFLQEGIAFNEYETGKALAGQIREASFQGDPNIILLFDAVNRLEGQFRMNYGTPFIRGMKEVIGTWPNIAGARMLGDMKFKPTHQWVNGEMTQNSALALCLSGNIRMDYVVMHGCKPASAYHTVTATQGANILEIDHKPALSFVQEILGPDMKDNLKEIKYFVTLGRNIADPWADFDPANYINRMCVGVDKRSNGLFMAEMDFEPGTRIQLMRRSFQMDYVSDQTRGLIDQVHREGRKPVFAMYFNCAGRAASYSDNTDEDMRYVQQAIGGEFPMMGFYEAGELAKIGGELQVLDWTGIFCLFSQ